MPIFLLSLLVSFAWSHNEGPVQITSFSQYSCVSTDNNAEKYHFYFQERTPPAVVRVDERAIVCHDTIYGTNDHETFPRLEYTAQAFKVWDSSDFRFYDNDGNGSIDINDQIIRNARLYGEVINPRTIFFTPVTLPTSVEMSRRAGNYKTQFSTGWMMYPYMRNYKSQCLTAADYNSASGLFRAIGQLILVDTEGLYVGEAQNALSKDYVLLNETDLKKVWFYIKNGVMTAPTDDMVATVPVYFYYPLNPANPYQRSAAQKTYQLRGAQELNLPTGHTYPAHDRKIGCIPKY